MRLSLLLVLLLTFACGNEEEHKKQLSAIEQQAQERLTKAQNEAKVKAADLEREIEDLKGKLAEAESKAKEAVARAEASAEEQAKAAEQALAKARQAYKDKARLELSEANKDLAEVSAKASKVPAKAKAAFQKAVSEAKKAQGNVAKDIAAFDTATLETLRSLSAKVQTDLSLMRAKIKAAKAKVP